jgi:hypothetical protein
MLKNFLALFRRHEATPATPKPPPPKATMSDGELTAAITLLKAHAYSLRSLVPWQRIPKVETPVKFMGWGYVSGRTEGIKVNSKITITEADDCMDFVEYCVLVNREPTLLMLFKQGQLRITAVAEREFVAAVFNVDAMPLNNLEQYKSLPPAVQKVMHDVLRFFFLQFKDRKTDAYDQLISY